MLRLMPAGWLKLPPCMRAPLLVVRLLTARLCLNMCARYAVMPARRSPSVSWQRLCDDAMRVKGDNQVFEYVEDEHPGGTYSELQRRSKNWKRSAKASEVPREGLKSGTPPLRERR